MSSTLKFLFFIIYSTCIFFLPNNKFIILLLLINFIFIILLQEKIKRVIKSTIKIVPFIVFTFLINCLMDSFTNSVYIGLKLLIVCNATVIYSYSTSISEVSKTIKNLCMPLKIFKINPQDIELLVSISLSMLPILKKELNELKDACKAKNMSFNIKNSKYILSKLFLSIIRKTNHIEEALINKGYN